MEQYSSLADIYDENINIDYSRWACFVKDAFKREGKNILGAHALELGCGSGNMTMELKKMGFDITGLDISEDMLRIACEKALNNYFKIRFVKQDITQLNMNGHHYKGVFGFCDVFNYITCVDQLNECFKRVYSCLEPGGLFIFDISSIYKLKEIIGNNTFTRNDDKLCYIWDNYQEGDLLEMYITFFVKQERFYRRFDETHIQRAYACEAMTAFLNQAGFKAVDVYDDYSFKAPGQKSLRLTFIAKKEE